jgi:hypothetical protein
MLGRERAFLSGSGQPNKEAQPRRVNPDSPELIAHEWQELGLAEIREILTREQEEWVESVLKKRLKKQGKDFESLSSEEKEEEKEKLIEELREIKTREELLGKLKELKELGLDTTKIINLFGLVYIPDDYTVIAVTDIHGDIDALEAAIGEFEAKKRETERVAFVCMGDFVDRGEYNFEVVKRLFELKRKYQDEVIILKGDHEDDVFDIRIGKPYSIKIDGATFANLLFRSVQDRDEKIMELYVETFSKLPHAVMYRDILLTHAGIPVIVNFLEEENRCVIDEESIAIGRLIQPEESDFREINWADIDPEIEEGVVKNIDRYPPEYHLHLNQIDIHKYSPKELTRILNKLGFSYFIRGHQYSYRKVGLLFKGSDLAYHRQEGIITFHSNQSCYGGKEYKEGCYLILNPNGSIVAKGVLKEGQERTIVPPRKEVSAQETSEGQPSQAELTSEGTMGGGERARNIEETPSEGDGGQETITSQESGQQQGPEIQLQPESLEDKIRKHLEGLLQGYKEYIELLGYDLSGFSKRFIENLLQQNLQELQREVEIRTQSYMSQNPGAVKEAIETAFVNEVFSEYRDSIEATLRRYLGVLFLDSEALFNNEKAREKVVEFLRKKCSIDDIRMFLNNVGIIVDHIPVEVEGRKITFRLEGQKVQINRVWTPTLLMILHEQTKDKKEVEKFLRELIEKIRQNINVLKENYKRKYIEEIKNKPEKLEEIKANLRQRLGGGDPTKEELNRAIEQEAERLAEETIKQLMEDIEKTLPVLTDLSGEQLEAHLRALQGLAEQLGEAKEKAEKEGKKEIDWGPILDNIKLVGGLLASGFLLWIAFLGFFAPLWLIERVKKDVKI